MTNERTDARPADEHYQHAASGQRRARRARCRSPMTASPAHADATSSATATNATASTAGVTGHDAQPTHCQPHAVRLVTRIRPTIGSLGLRRVADHTCLRPLCARGQSARSRSRGRDRAGKDSGKIGERQAAEVAGEPVERAFPAVLRRRLVVALACVAVESVAGARIADDVGLHRRRHEGPTRRSSTPSTGIIASSSPNKPSHGVWSDPASLASGPAIPWLLCVIPPP